MPLFGLSARASVGAKARGAEAPLRTLVSLRHAVENDAATALTFERSTFLELRSSSQSRALRHVFFAERAAASPPEIAGLVPGPIGLVAVIGGGTMGVGIAAALRDADIPLILIERDGDAVARAETNLARLYDGAVERGRISADRRDAKIAGVRFSSDYESLAAADFAIEAVFEDLDVKRSVFKELDRVMRPDAVLATNTSYLDPNAIAEAASRSERVIGLHFFSPANLMKLLEIVPTARTAPDVLAASFALAKTLRKVPVLAGVCDGFIGNRLLKITRQQCERLLLSGSTPTDIDRAMQAFGMPMGPFAVQDLAGLDIGAMQREAARSRGETPFAPVAERLCAIDRFGQKTGGGWYDYAEGSRTPIASPLVADIITEQSKSHTQHAALTDRERVERIIFPMVDEAARILEEGIARRPGDIDLVEIHGYGFPRWRGGLMHDAEAFGLQAIVERLHTFTEEGSAEPPCERLLEAARRSSFSS